MNKGIDLKQFKKFLNKDIGPRCKDYNWDCMVCRSWKLYDEVKSYLDYLKWIEMDDVSIKKVRPHEKT